MPPECSSITLEFSRLVDEIEAEALESSITLLPPREDPFSSVNDGVIGFPLPSLRACWISCEETPLRVKVSDRSLLTRSRTPLPASVRLGSGATPFPSAWMEAPDFRVMASLAARMMSFPLRAVPASITTFSALTLSGVRPFLEASRDPPINRLPKLQEAS